MFLLIFAAAVTSMAGDFGFARWEDLMPYSAGAYLLYGVGSLPSGRLGDVWGRRSMMVVFYFGMGGSALLCAITRTPWQLAGAMVLIGAFASIYHPVGIPMLLQNAQRPGATIGLSGLSGQPGHCRRCAADRTSHQVAGLARRLCGSGERLHPAGAALSLGRAAGARSAGAAQDRRRQGALVAGDVGAGPGGDDGRVDHRRHPVQLHNQRQCPVAQRAVPRHRGATCGAGRTARRRVCRRLAGADRRRAAARPVRAEAAVSGASPWPRSRSCYWPRTRRAGSSMR